MRPQRHHADLVAGWSRSAREAAAWVSRPDHPFPPSVATWWEAAGVSPWLLLEPTGAPVAYGEPWDDVEEDEIELARLIVDPWWRRRGVGRRLVDAPAGLARASGRSACFLRVVPGNAAALALYRSAGFRDVDPALVEEWNRGQPTPYVWLQLAEGGPAGGPPPRRVTGLTAGPRRVS